MEAAALNADVLELMERRKALVAELNDVEKQLSAKRRLLIQQREVETAAHDVFRHAERRSSCVL